MLDVKKLLTKILKHTESKTLLWTNTTSPSTFSPQTVLLALSSYDHVEVWFYDAGVSDVMLQNPCSVKIGCRNDVLLLHTMIGPGVNENVGQRSVSASTTGVTFTDYKYKNRRSGGTTTTANQFCVPHYIYGVKFVG